MDREAIFSALFAKVSGLTSSFTTISRRTQMVDEMQGSAMPALFQMQLPQIVDKPASMPPKYNLQAQWLIYVYQPDKSQPMSTPLNQLIDVVSNALKPTAPVAKQTLGGLVEDAAIVGTVELYEGLLEDRAVAVLPIRIIVPGW